MAKITDASGQPFSGIVPFAVVALVIDNVDPLRLGRVRVRYPTLPGQPPSTWIRIATPAAGSEQGFYALPAAGDEVLVLFVQGSQDEGVVVGHLWNGARMPPPEAAGGAPLDLSTLPPPRNAAAEAPGSSPARAQGGSGIESNDRRVWRSRSGHVVVFDDHEGAETVQIWDGRRSLAVVLDGAHERVVVSSTGDLHLHAGRNLILEAGHHVQIEAGGRLRTTSAGDTEHLAEGSYAMRAQGAASLVARQTFEARSEDRTFTCRGRTTVVEGLASVEVKGGRATVKATGAVVVRGASISLN